MKIPDTVKIYGKNYKIKFEKDMLADENSWGYVNHRTMEIVLLQDADPQRSFETLLHEVIETIKFDNQLDIDHKTIFILACGINAFLRDNNLLKE